MSIIGLRDAKQAIYFWSSFFLSLEDLTKWPFPPSIFPSCGCFDFPLFLSFLDLSIFRLDFKNLVATWMRGDTSDCCSGFDWPKRWGWKNVKRGLGRAQAYFSSPDFTEQQAHLTNWIHALFPPKLNFLQNFLPWEMVSRCSWHTSWSSPFILPSLYFFIWTDLHFPLLAISFSTAPTII